MLFDDKIPLDVSFLQKKSTKWLPHPIISSPTQCIKTYFWSLSVNISFFYSNLLLLSVNLRVHTYQAVFDQYMKWNNSAGNL